jgi:hypothetical protein
MPLLDLGPVVPLWVSLATGRLDGQTGNSAGDPFRCLIRFRVIVANFDPNVATHSVKSFDKHNICVRLQLIATFERR